MQKQSYVVADTFNIQTSSEFRVMGFADEGNPYVPHKTPYIFRKETLGDVLAFLSNPGGDGLFVSGPTGSGKTSLIKQVAARLNWPVQVVNCHARMELMDLVGQHTLENGSMQLVDGPLATAVRYGHILLLNEMDIMEPAETTGLHDVLDGAPLVIPHNGGEVIEPHPAFRLVATGNSSGRGENAALYSGVQMQNLAFLDRFEPMKVDYPQFDEEIEILAQCQPNLPERYLACMIRTANEIRRLFVGEGEGADAELSVTMSTRTLIRWARKTLQFKGAPNALAYGLDRSLTNRVEGAERDAIHKIAAGVFGDDWQEES